MGMGESRLHYGMSLRLYFEEKAFGPGMVMLLREVERTGSLQKAAKNMNMAYSKAWKMLKGAEKEWGFALTDRETGGKDGGGFGRLFNTLASIPGPSLAVQPPPLQNTISCGSIISLHSFYLFYLFL